MGVKRFIGMLSLSLAVGWFANGLGIPLWTGWVPGDAGDIAVAVFVGLSFLCPQPPAQRDLAD